MKLNIILLFANIFLLYNYSPINGRKIKTKSTRKSKAAEQILPHYLTNRHIGKFPIPLPTCDYLQESITFYPNFPNSLSHTGWYYLSPQSANERSHENNRVDFVSNLRRAIDTYTYSFWPIDARNTTMTSDIQELGANKDAIVSDKARKKTDGRPDIDKHQRETLNLLAKDSKELNNNDALIEQAVKVEEDRVKTVYNSLKLHHRIKDHEGWTKSLLSLRYDFNDYFLNDLEEQCRQGKQVVVAVGHSMYWQKFVKTYYNGLQGSCSASAENKLSNGAFNSMVVKFDKNCKAFPKFDKNHPTKHTTVSGCKLLFGSLHGKVTGCDQESTKINDEIRDGMIASDKQILLIVGRHGESHWNNAKADNILSTITEMFYYDSPLYPPGVLDAVSLNNRLHKSEAINDCNMCGEDRGCGKYRHCAKNYQS